MDYYGNNDWRDYLAHYGVKGMKWGKRKRKIITTESGTSGAKNDYQYKTLGINNKNGRLASLSKTTNKNTGDSYYELTTKRKKNGNTYDRSNKAFLNYSDDEDYRTVGFKINKKTMQKKLSSIGSSAKKKAKSFIKSISNKKLKKKNKS